MLPIIWNKNNNNMAVILSGGQPQDRNMHMFCNLESLWELILNKFIIYNIWYIRWRKPCQLPGRMNNSSYQSGTALFEPPISRTAWSWPWVNSLRLYSWGQRGPCRSDYASISLFILYKMFIRDYLFILYFCSSLVLQTD